MIGNLKLIANLTTNADEIPYLAELLQYYPIFWSLGLQIWSTILLFER